MRNFLRYFTLAVAFTALFSCSKEDMQQSDAQEYVQVKFAVQVPGEATKAIGKGVLANNLDFAVYRSEAYTAPDGTIYPAGEFLKGMSDPSNATVTPKGNGEWEVVLTLRGRHETVRLLISASPSWELVRKTIPQDIISTTQVRTADISTNSADIRTPLVHTSQRKAPIMNGTAL